MWIKKLFSKCKKSQLISYEQYSTNRKNAVYSSLIISDDKDRCCNNCVHKWLQVIDGKIDVYCYIIWQSVDDCNVCDLYVSNNCD